MFKINSTIKNIFLLIIMTLSFSAKAESIEILLGGWSKHYIDTEEVFNESHKMIGVKYGNWSFGKFTNSYNNKSVFLNKTFEIYKYNNLSLNVVSGIVTGYTKKQTHDAYIGNGNSILLMPEISYKLKMLTINNTIIPQGGGFILTSSLSIRF